MALLGSVTVYAVTSGKMNEIPFIKRLGLKFSDEYEDYKDNDVFQEVKNEETKAIVPHPRDSHRCQHTCVYIIGRCDEERLYRRGTGLFEL